MTSDLDWGGFRFDAHKACVVCTHILEGRPVVFVAHHADGDLQFLCDKQDHTEAEAAAVGLAHVLELHPSLKSIGYLPAGSMAALADGQWTICDIQEDD
jgi:hypothetical protein